MRVTSIILLFYGLGIHLLSANYFPSETKGVDSDQILGKLARDYMEIRYPTHKVGSFIYIGIKRQKLFYINDSIIELKFSVSTSKYGIGSDYNSHKTPLGLHRVESKIGHDVPKNGIILGKTYTGKNAEIITEAKSGKTDDVTSRALRLEGVEKGLNLGGKKDSYTRDIYIHGTPEEGLIGQPASHGCIRLKNDDVITLFDTVEKGTYVLILNN